MNIPRGQGCNLLIPVCRETEAARVQWWGNGFSIPLPRLAAWPSDGQLLTPPPQKESLQMTYISHIPGQLQSHGALVSPFFKLKECPTRQSTYKLRERWSPWICSLLSRHCRHAESLTGLLRRIINAVHRSWPERLRAHLGNTSH